MTTPSSLQQQQQVTPYSVLIIGASGRTGVACIRTLSRSPQNNQPATEIHAFCRDPSKLDPSVRAMCTSVHAGNACQETDVETALRNSRANWIIVSIGNGDNVAKTDIRAVSAQVIRKVVVQPCFEHIRVLVVSSTGASASKIIVGMGIGQLIAFYLRHILSDHTAQESVFWSRALRHRTTIVRTTALTDHHATGTLVTFGDAQKSPSLQTDRADLAHWIVQEIFREDWVPRIVNVTSVKC